MKWHIIASIFGEMEIDALNGKEAAIVLKKLLQEWLVESGLFIGPVSVEPMYQVISS